MPRIGACITQNNISACYENKKYVKYFFAYKNYKVLLSTAQGHK